MEKQIQDKWNLRDAGRILRDSIHLLIYPRIYSMCTYVEHLLCA